MWVLRTKLVLCKSNRCPQVLGRPSSQSLFFSEVLRLEPRPRREMGTHPTTVLRAQCLELRVKGLR